MAGVALVISDQAALSAQKREQPPELALRSGGLSRKVGIARTDPTCFYPGV
jgi:hypothetical protein